MRELCGPLAALALSAACTERLEVLSTPTPSPDAGASGAFSLSCGDEHACLVRGGALFCWGANADGQLGVGSTAAGLTPAQVGVDESWVQVSAGEAHTCARKADGSVWCWGANGAGQLGQGDTRSRSVPTHVGVPAALAVDAHASFSCALDGEGALWCWGANWEGQLGLGDTFPGADQVSPRRVPDAGFRAFSAGQGHACAVRLDGTLWCWGRNTSAQLGLGPDAGIQLRAPQLVSAETDWLAVDANQEYTCALRQDHSLWCWGGLPLSGGVAERPARQGTGGWAGVSTNVFHACALSLSGEGACWGRNLEGQLGLGDRVDRPALTPLPDRPLTHLSAGRFATCARRASGSVWCTGLNSAGQLGVGDTALRESWTQLSFP